MFGAGRLYPVRADGNHMEVGPVFPWTKKSRRGTSHTYTPARQRALTRRSYGAAALAVVVLILALSQFGEDGLATYLKLRSQEKELVSDVGLLKKQNDQMEKKLHDLATDPSTLEELAREEHNMQRPHEEILTVFPETRKNLQVD